jgi:iduronate 2-sulfatase
MGSISRRQFVIGAAAASAGVATLGVGWSARTGRKPPNVLYVTADDLGTTLGAYGSEQVVSPNIDAFADRSLLFERCHCQIAICSSSRTSILTGVRPERSGLIPLHHDWQATIPEARSLPRTFKEHGYRTASVGKIFDRKGGGPDDCWDHWESEIGVEDSTVAIQELERLSQQEAPFFLAVGYAQPHCPWEPTAASMALYDVDRVEPLGPGRRFERDMVSCAGASGPEVDDAEVREITARFFGAITDVDRAFGDLLASVDELGLFDDTIVIFWSGDHGFQAGHNDWWGKWSCHDASTRVPLLLSVPGMATAGRRTAGIVECVDMYPTLLELCGLEPPPQPLDGRSFAPLIDEPSQRWKHSAFSVFGIEEIGQRSITTEQYNYIEVLPTPLREHRIELYDLVADPDESEDLYAARPEVAEVLAARLELGPDAALPEAPPIRW